MSSNAFQSLQSLLGAFSTVSAPICRFSSAQEISEHLVKLDTLRAQLLNDFSKANPELEHLQRSVGVSPADFFIDCSAVIAVASGLQCALSEFIQGKIVSRVNRIGDLSQEETHLLVDLWGQVEASKALFEFTLRHSESYIRSSAQQSITADSLRAQYRVMVSALEELIVALGVRFGERVSMSDAGMVVDWGLRVLRNGAYHSLANAVNQEIFGLTA